MLDTPLTILLFIFITLLPVGHAAAQTHVELNVPPISGKTISLFCNMTALIDDHTEAALEYVWIRDDITLMAEDKYMGLGTDRINVTVSTRVRLVFAHTNGWVYLIIVL